MAVWMVRGGRDGVFEQVALEKGLAIIGWAEMPDLSRVTTQQEIRALCERAYPDAPEARIRYYVGRLWAFRERMKPRELVMMPLKGRAAIAVGEIDGPYEYRQDLPGRATHVRRVKWLRTDVARTALDPDLLQSLSGRGTLGEIRIDGAEERVHSILAGTRVPPPSAAEDDIAASYEAPDLELFARDQITQHIGRNYRDHDLARLVDELLKAQGYQTQLSPPGPDGGVDILVGAGPMGFDPPRLCVQVKSSTSPVDVGVLRELQGVMKNFGADQGLLVSWGGFKASVETAARQLFFEIRLWNADDLVSELLQHYEKLPEELRAELPLKPIYILVPEDQGQ